MTGPRHMQDVPSRRFGEQPPAKTKELPKFQQLLDSLAHEHEVEVDRACQSLRAEIERLRSGIDPVEKAMNCPVEDIDEADSSAVRPSTADSDTSLTELSGAYCFAEAPEIVLPVASPKDPPDSGQLQFLPPVVPYDGEQASLISQESGSIKSISGKHLMKRESASGNFRASTGSCMSSGACLLVEPANSRGSVRNSNMSHISGVSHISFSRDARSSEMSAIDDRFSGVVSEEDSEEYSALGGLELHPCWEKFTPTQTRSRRAAHAVPLTHMLHQSHANGKDDTWNSASDEDAREDQIDGVSVLVVDANAPCWERCLQGFIMTPQRRLGWDFLGMILIGYDLVVIPMQVFDPPENVVTTVIALFTTVFWTLDIPMSFIAGYHQGGGGGVVEMRPRKVARHYVSGWFPFDFMVVFIDYSVLIAQAIGQQMLRKTSTGYMRFARIVRFARLLRLVRLLKAHGTLSDLLERINDETMLILVGVLKILISIMVLNHLIACAWYGIGVLEVSSDTWVKSNGVLDDPEKGVGYRYATALHWSLTQFTPASMEVVPENTIERFFCTMVIVFAMVAFSSFISSITGAMTRIRSLDAERIANQTSLRRYLFENHASHALVSRIHHSVNSTMKKSKRRLHEKDVSMLTVLPWSLKADLRDEIYMPIFSRHPFLARLLCQYRTQRRKLWSTGVTELSLPISHELFTPSDVAENMYFILTGTMFFTEEENICPASEPEQTMSSLLKPQHTIGLDDEEEPSDPRVRTAGMWASEASLWIKRRHTGQLVAVTHCEVLCLNGEKFREAMHARESVKYAQEFAHFFQNENNMNDLTDVWADLEILDDFAECAFEEDEEDHELDSLDGGRKSRTRGSVQSGSHEEDTRPSILKQVINLGERIGGAFGNTEGHHRSSTSSLFGKMFRRSSSSRSVSDGRRQSGKRKRHSGNDRGSKTGNDRGSVCSLPGLNEVSGEDLDLPKERDLAIKSVASEENGKTPHGEQASVADSSTGDEARTGPGTNKSAGAKNKKVVAMHSESEQFTAVSPAQQDDLPGQPVK